MSELQVLFELPDNIFYAPNENYALYDVDVDDRGRPALHLDAESDR